MKRQIALFFLIIFLFLLNACNDRNQSIYYQLVPTTFVDALTIEGTVDAVNSSTIACPRRISGTVVYLIDDGVTVKKGDTICILENKELANDYEDFLANVEKSEAQYVKSKADLDMDFAVLRAQVEINEAQTSITNLDSAQLFYLSPQQRKIKELELKRAQIEKEKYKKKLQFLEQINSSELKKLKLKIDRTKYRADRILERLNSLVLISPQDGLVVRGISWVSGNKVQEGDMAYSGMPLVTIPDLSKMKVTIQAPESAYKRISENDPIEYTFDAMPGNRAWGKILQKAPIGKPISRNSKVKYFEVTASIDSFKVNPDLGISANAKITIAQLNDTIVVSQLAIFNDDSITVVYVKNGSRFEKREVLVGASSPKEAVVTTGLLGNEVLSFEKPLSSKITLNTLLPDSLKKNNGAIIPIETKEDKPLVRNKMKMDN